MSYIKQHPMIMIIIGVLGISMSAIMMIGAVLYYSGLENHQHESIIRRNQ